MGKIKKKKHRKGKDILTKILVIFLLFVMIFSTIVSMFMMF